MNLKQAKRIRKHTRYYIRGFLGNPDVSERSAEYVRLLVPSKLYDTTVTTTDPLTGEKTTKQEEGKAIQIRLVEGCGREVYKRVKRRVIQNNRRAKRAGILQRIRSGVARAAAAGAAGVVDNAGAA